VSLAPLRMSVPASDGLILKGALNYPPGATGGSYPLAVLAHQYPATRDSDSIVSPRGPVVVDTPPFEGAASAEALSRGLGNARARIVPGSGHAMAIYFAVRDELVGFLHHGLGL